MPRKLVLMVVVLAVSVLTAVGLTASRGAETGQLWTPNQSSAGGSQYDPRLDKPVKMWEAGIEVGAVFAKIKKQTGVYVVCSPPDDENAWIPMNIFLNEKNPPTLRSLLVQVSWALNCKFFVHGEPGQQVYELEHSLAASAALARMEAEAKADVQAMKDAPKAIKARLDEYLAALVLSPQDLVAQYQGKDDRLLLNLLEPHRRAALGFLNSDGIQPKIQKFLDEADWSAAPGSVIGSSTGASGVRNIDEAGKVLVPSTILTDDQLKLFTEALPDAATSSPPGSRWAFSASSDGETGLEEPPPPGGNMDVNNRTGLQITPPDWRLELSPEDAVTLEALVRGTPYSPEERAERVKQVTEQQALARYAADKESAEEERPLTVAMVELLSGTTLDLKEDAPFWRVQEAAAKATGMDVVAESLYRGEPATSPKRPGKPTPPTALSAIERYTRTSLAPFRPTRPLPHPAWHWHGVGNFLTFRSGDPDVWRGGAAAASDAGLCGHARQTLRAQGRSQEGSPLQHRRQRPDRGARLGQEDGRLDGPAASLWR